MASVFCPDCGKDVPGGAPACPDCGRPLGAAKEAAPKAQAGAGPKAEPPKARKGILKKSIIGFLILVAVGGLLESRKSAEENGARQRSLAQQAAEREQNETGATGTGASGREPAAIEAARLFQLFSENAAAAEKEYMGRRIAVAGAIHKIKSTPLGRPEIIFVVSADEHMVKCRFPAQYADQITDLREGRHVVIVGTVEAFVPDSILCLGDCLIAQ